MKRIVLLMLLPFYLQVQGYGQTAPTEVIRDGKTFTPGIYQLANEDSRNGYLNFDHIHQRLVVLEDEYYTSYSASEVSSFRYTLNQNTPYEREVIYITWRYQSDWPAYERMTFFEVLADFRNCAVVIRDRAPEVIDQYRDSTEVFVAKMVQGRSYMVILPDGEISEYHRDSADDHLRIILEKDYGEVMRYAYERGLRPTRFEDFVEILRYAAQLRL